MSLKNPHGNPYILSRINSKERKLSDEFYIIAGGLLGAGLAIGLDGITHGVGYSIPADQMNGWGPYIIQGAVTLTAIVVGAGSFAQSVCGRYGIFKKEAPERDLFLVEHDAARQGLLDLRIDQTAGACSDSPKNL